MEKVARNYVKGERIRGNWFKIGRIFAKLCKNKESKENALKIDNLKENDSKIE